ncbi:MAG: cell entry protein, partial [Deltaproteobacteria bacterium]|nr:cell entry protein [Deltaproteobacteria bacterium]
MKRIVLRTYMKELKSYIPVYIEVYRDRFEVVTQGADMERPQDRIDTLIERGLRAQLVPQSMITGQLLIEMDMRPGTPVSLKNLD